MLEKDRNILLSVIIPVYNVEDYLEKCLMSCMNIGLPISSYEVIVVNDGSPDNSLAIANRLAAKYNNIKIYSKENGGLSSARNFGVEKAQGDYIWFLDSDDYIITNNLSFVLEICIEKDLEVLAFNWRRVDLSGVELPCASLKILQDDVVAVEGKDVFNKLKGTYFAHRFILKKSFIVKYKFTEGLYYEDLDLFPQVLLDAQKVLCISDTLYAYLDRPGSILNSVNSRLISDALIIAEKYRLLISTENNLYESVYKQAIICALHNAIRQGIDVSLVINYIKNNCVADIYIGKAFKFKCLNILFRISPKLLVLILKVRNKFFN